MQTNQPELCKFDPTEVVNYIGIAVNQFNELAQAGISDNANALITKRIIQDGYYLKPVDIDYFFIELSRSKWYPKPTGQTVLNKFAEFVETRSQRAADLSLDDHQREKFTQGVMPDRKTKTGLTKLGNAINKISERIKKLEE